MTDSHLALVGYEHYYGMMADSVRMHAYRDAIFAVVRQGDVVLDLGAGLGILGMWAAQAGASRVYAIEKTSSIELARQVAHLNRLDEVHAIVQGLSTEVDLPERADVLISETLGSFAIDENTLPYIVDARSRLLAPGAVVLPHALLLFAAPVELPRAWERIDIWRRVEGVDYSPAFDLFAGKMMVETVEPDDLLGPPVQLATIDLSTHVEASLRASTRMRMRRPGTIHGVSGWFRAHLTGDVSIDTAPDQEPTHWKQAFFPFREPIQVVAGDILEWSLRVEGGLEADGTRLTYDYRCTQLAQELRPPIPTSEVGRNDPCPCGSGRKFKRCCGS